MTVQTFERWERWMLPIALESHGGSLDPDTGYQALRMELRFPSDPACFYGFLGEQVRSCVFRPSAVFVENFLDGIGDELLEPDPATFEISNVCESEVGLDAVCVGYHFRLRFQWRDRYGECF
jgi:hypothetical protein